MAKKRKRHRNFWGEWERERRRRWQEHGPTPTEARGAWREFFHDFTGDMPEEHWVFGARRFQPWHRGDVSFNPFVANLFSQSGGLLPLVVLHLLDEKPRYGNEIMTLLSERTSGRWVANPGAIYPLMATLEKRGLAVSEWEDPHKRTVRTYRITEFGKREMQRVKAIVRPKLEEAVDVLQIIINEIKDEDEDGDDTPNE
jgi:DNA-binding PadR family transcriptional regulator